jgi:MtN3 and saliva related transmembrane protein
MKALIITGIGMAAGFCTTFSFLPQVIKTIRTRRTKDISKGMYATLSLGLFLWMVYGFFLHDMPLILTNSISLSLALVVLGLKIRHG